MGDVQKPDELRDLSEIELCPYCDKEHSLAEPCIGPCPLPRACPVSKTGIRCVVCPLTFACPVCGAGAGERCRRPSGHRGPWVKTHVPRLELSDKAALESFPAGVVEELGEEAARRWAEKLKVALPDQKGLRC